MSNLISRQWLMECVNEGWIKFDTEKDNNRFNHLVIDIAPSAQPEQRWIHISERLPEDREWYLAVFKEKDTGFQLIPRVADYIGKGENKWRIIDEEGLCQEYRDKLECIAWMPLPEPYKAESEGEE